MGRRSRRAVLVLVPLLEGVNMQPALAPFSLGFLIALIVLVVAIIFILVDGNTHALDLIAALAVARMT